MLSVVVCRALFVRCCFVFAGLHVLFGVLVFVVWCVSFVV